MVCSWETSLPGLFVRAALYEEGNQREQAISIYETLLDRYPAFAPAMRNLAMLLVEDPAEVEACKRWALLARETIKDDLDLADVLARITFGEGNHEHAVTLLNEIGEATQLTGKQLYMLGKSHAAIGNRDEARKALMEALQLGLSAAEQADARELLKSVN